ncbi:putative cyclin-D6-1 isoform X1 [Neltuma alba]|uniref:putative cyclin-D6-1 isoform X1 n=1 Tax=Neltuma alba TaxID=207710 RepID=UPI0010A3B3C3|nr:putative cyclin-D6-1 isoform X1 [Prosopis alba]
MEFDLENPLQNFCDPPSSLFLIESHHIPPQTYFRTLKSRDFDITVRREVISLIYQLSCTFDPLLSYLAVNYVDRFLANQGISQPKPWILRLLAVSCLSLAAKMTRTEFSVSDIQGEGGMIFEAPTVRRMELLILGALKWRMRSITPFSFVPFFIALLRLKDLPLRHVLKERATEIIIRSQKEIRLLEFKPSVVAASALLSASHELLPFQYPCFLRAIFDCAYVNKENILKCNNVIQDITMEGNESAFDLVSSSETPINVLDHHFLSSESTKTGSITIAASTLRQEKDIKRRKIAGYGDSHALQISQIEQC